MLKLKPIVRFVAQSVDHPNPLEIVMNARQALSGAELCLLELDSSTEQGVAFSEGLLPKKITAGEVIATFRVSANKRLAFTDVSMTGPPTQDPKYALSVLINGQTHAVWLSGQQIWQEWKDERSRDTITFEVALQLGGVNYPYYVRYNVPVKVLAAAGNFSLGGRYDEASRSVESSLWYGAFFDDGHTKWMQRIKALEAAMATSIRDRALPKDTAAALFQHCLEYLNSYNPWGSWGEITVELIDHYLGCGSGCCGITTVGSFGFFNMIDSHGSKAQVDTVSQWVNARLQYIYDDGPVLETYQQRPLRVAAPLLDALDKIRADSAHEGAYRSRIYERACVKVAQLLLAPYGTRPGALSGTFIPGADIAVQEWLDMLDAIISTHPLLGYLSIRNVVDNRDEYLENLKALKLRYDPNCDAVYRLLYMMRKWKDRQDTFNSLLRKATFTVLGDGKLENLGHPLLKSLFQHQPPSMVDATLAEEVRVALASFSCAMSGAALSLDDEMVHIPRYVGNSQEVMDSNLQNFYHYPYQNESVRYSKGAVAVYNYCVFAEQFLKNASELSLPVNVKPGVVYDVMRGTTIFGHDDVDDIVDRIKAGAVGDALWLLVDGAAVLFSGGSSLALKFGLKGFVTFAKVGLIFKGLGVVGDVRKAFSAMSEFARPFHALAASRFTMKQSYHWRCTVTFYHALGILDFLTEKLDRNNNPTGLALESRWVTKSYGRQGGGASENYSAEYFAKCLASVHKHDELFGTRLPPVTAAHARLLPVMFTVTRPGTPPMSFVAVGDFFAKPTLRFIDGRVDDKAKAEDKSKAEGK